MIPNLGFTELMIAVLGMVVIGVLGFAAFVVLRVLWRLGTRLGNPK